MNKLLFSILISVAVLAVGPAQAAICGLYRIEDVSEGDIYSLSDLHSRPFRQTHYSISNPTSSAVSQMLNNNCYCVEGEVSRDPEWPNDDSFKILEITSVLFGPYSSCYPSP